MLHDHLDDEIAAQEKLIADLEADITAAEVILLQLKSIKRRSNAQQIHKQNESSVERT